MRKRLLFAAGLAAGYVVGARSGRGAYEALMARLTRTAADPHVQQAMDAFETRAPTTAAVVEGAAETARGVAAAAQEAGEPEAAD